jgi:CHAT domain-containing protein
VGQPSAIAQTPITPNHDPNSLADQARTEYAAANYANAATLFEQAAAMTAAPLQQGALWANASLAYQQVGAWTAAADRMQQARQLVFPLPSETPETLAIAAQIHDIDAQLKLSQGQPEAAAIAWEAAAIAYTDSNNPSQAWAAQLNQAQALQAGGFYKLSLELLTTLTTELANEPPTELTVEAYRSLGDLYRLTSNLTEAEPAFLRSLALAQALQLPDEVSLTYRRLGDLTRLQTVNNRDDLALDYYDQAESLAVSPLVQFQAGLGKLRLLVDTEQWQLAYPISLELWAARTDLPASRNSLYARIELMQYLQAVRAAIASTLSDANPVPELPWYGFVQDTFGTELNTLRHATTSTLSRTAGDKPLWYAIDKRYIPLMTLGTELVSLRQSAQALGDVQAEATVLSVLGGLYAQVGDLATARELIQAGLVLAQSNNLGQVAYSLQAQLGQIELAQGDRRGAIAAYKAAVQTLQTLREDVVAVSSEAQYSFQQSIEPIYRELATLLLTDETAADSPENLQQAREVIELLQLADLDNFFREACLSGETIDIDQLDSRAAVLYPILLPDGLDVVVSLPNREYRNFRTTLEAETLNQTLTALRTALEQPGDRGLGAVPTNGAPAARTWQDAVLPPATQLYDWLIRPIETYLADSGTQTLVFVLDGPLRNVPMSTLYDGQQFLVEKYAIALTPGLRLVDPRPLPKANLSVLLAGLSEVGQAEAARNFPPLPDVETEVANIGEVFPSNILLNDDFNRENFTTQVGTLPTPIVHIATHGKFSSVREDTFILTWDDSLSATEFSDLLLASELSREAPIELLVLSACETAKGDNLSALGLAGIAVRSGARSTLASLWQVNDPATAQLMSQFYRNLANPQVTKAKAIQQAQLSLFRSDQYKDPYFWSAFVLLGNWL